ncbi:unnamed protein product [Mycena citricolor]|uniref:Uncharacterized protein n=1 Tax=Mycena citricolor TaxID=2018698 RepID=A0AAD2GVQ9_9AGAR|nr:unnamed protein product [Mycena citricolor]
MMNCDAAVRGCQAPRVRGLHMHLRAGRSSGETVCGMRRMCVLGCFPLRPPCERLARYGVIGGGLLPVARDPSAGARMKHVPELALFSCTVYAGTPSAHGSFRDAEVWYWTGMGTYGSGESCTCHRGPSVQCFRWYPVAHCIRSRIQHNLHGRVPMNHRPGLDNGLLCIAPVR